MWYTEPMTISFETWHVYWTNRVYPLRNPWDTSSADFSMPLDPSFEFEMQKGKQIQGFLEPYLGWCQRIWFHDDMIPRILQNASSSNWWRWQYFMNATKQWVYDRLAQDRITNIQEQNEYDLISEAESNSIPEILNSVRTNDVWRYDHEKSMLRWPRVNKKQQKIRLHGYRTYKNKPSCEVLDYTFYKKRLMMSSPTVTLIHESMKDQQSRVQQLFLLSWETPEVIVLFHDGESITSSEYCWQDAQNQLLSEKLGNM